MRVVKSSSGGNQPTICQNQLNKILLQCTTLCMTWVSSCWSWCSCEGFPSGKFCIPTNKLSYCPKVLIASDSKSTVKVTCQHLTHEAYYLLLKPDPAPVHLSHHSPSFICTYFWGDDEDFIPAYLYTVRRLSGDTWHFGPFQGPELTHKQHLRYVKEIFIFAHRTSWDSVNTS